MTINGDGQFSPDAAHQRLVNERFHDPAQRREQVYQREDLFSVIHQHRQARTLDWIDGLALPAGSQVLEVGPGAGFMTVELARRDFVLKAADSTPRMIEIASRRVAEAGVADRVRPLVAERAGVRLNARLQRLADDGVPWIRSGRGQYLVQARAPIQAGDARPEAPSPARPGLGHGHRARGTPCTFAVCR